MLSGRRGLTLVELMVAVSLFGVLAGAMAGLLVQMQRQFVRQVEQAELQVTLQSAAGLLTQEIRELDATDPAGGDVLDAADSSITYRALRGLYTTCRAVVGQALYLDTAVMGLRSADPESDSVLVLATGRSAVDDDDRWIHADLGSVAGGYDCPGGRPSVRLGIAPGVAPEESVLAGSPVRLFEVVQWRAYRDAMGDTWLGQRRHQKPSGWATLQPVAGPLAPRGLLFTYHGRDGLAGVPSSGPGLSRVGITIVARSGRAVRLGNLRVGRLLDTLRAEVALRNNRR